MRYKYTNKLTRQVAQVGCDSNVGIAAAATGHDEYTYYALLPPLQKADEHPQLLAVPASAKIVRVNCLN